MFKVKKQTHRLRNVVATVSRLKHTQQRQELQTCMRWNGWGASMARNAAYPGPLACRLGAGLWTMPHANDHSLA